MFTGIIEAVGTVEGIEIGRGGGALAISAPFARALVRGESVAVSGVCLTVVKRSAKTFRVEVSPETLRRTTLGRLVRGQTVNLERAARLGDRLGGHLVSGHVDGVGKLAGSRGEGNALVLDVDVPLSLGRYLIPKGSVALDGISLTVNSVRGRRFSVAIIPHTAEATTIGGKKAGDRFNVEVDLIGKYVEQLVQPHRKAGRGSKKIEN